MRALYMCCVLFLAVARFAAAAPVNPYQVTNWDRETCQSEIGNQYWDDSYGPSGACLCGLRDHPFFDSRAEDGQGACLSLNTWIEFQKTFDLVDPVELTVSGSRHAADRGTPPAQAPSTCHDCDGDGYSTDHDCDDWSYRIYPGAPEVAGNGVDEDCDGEDPPAVATPPTEAAPADLVEPEETVDPEDEAAEPDPEESAADPEADPEAEKTGQSEDEDPAEEIPEADAGSHGDPSPDSDAVNLLEETDVDASFQDTPPDHYTVGPGRMREYGGWKLRTASGTDNVYVSDEDGNHALELMVGREREDQDALNAVVTMPGVKLDPNKSYRLYFQYRSLHDFEIALAIHPTESEPKDTPQIHTVDMPASPDDWYQKNIPFGLIGQPAGTYDLSLGWANVKELLVLDHFLVVEQ